MISPLAVGDPSEGAAEARVDDVGMSTSGSGSLGISVAEESPPIAGQGADGTLEVNQLDVLHRLLDLGRKDLEEGTDRLRGRHIPIATALREDAWNDLWHSLFPVTSWAGRSAG